MRILFDCCVYFFAILGFVSSGIYVLVRYHITDVPGIIDPYSNLYQNSEDRNRSIQPSLQIDQLQQRKTSFENIKNQLIQLEEIKRETLQRYCRVKVLSDFAGANAQSIVDEYKRTHSDSILDKMFLAADIRLQDNQEYKKQKVICNNANNEFQFNDLDSIVGIPQNTQNIFPWGNDEIWQTLQKAVIKDKADIIKASQQADIDPRMLVAVMFVEQNRVYRTEREFVKSTLLPFSLLSTGSNTSLGTMNIKPQTAKEIEDHLTNPASEYYPGDQYKHLLDFSIIDHDQERIKRLTNYKNRYYSYLYGALYLKEYEKQWERAGFLILNRPEILGTLFNIGFKHSHPKASPQVGGSTIDIKGVHYTFGSLAYEFYYSGILGNEFPIFDYETTH